jgi:hypothetical protein
MPKTDNAAAKPKKAPKPKLTDKAQSERFIEAARKLGIEQTDETFGAVVKRVATARRDRRSSQTKTPPLKETT